jgi:hypothetical protein
MKCPSRRCLEFFLLLVLLAWTAPQRSAAEAAAELGNADIQPGAWILEFGPLVGYWSFDAVSSFEDAPLVGARLSARRSRHFQIEAEFTEVYTSRRITDNSARQISIAVHGRGMTWWGNWQPSVLGGIAFNGFDDSRDPDSFGEAWDFGLGLGHRLNHRWMLRGEWMLRYQRFVLFDPNRPPAMQDDAEHGTWAHSFLLGAHYAF